MEASKRCNDEINVAQGVACEISLWMSFKVLHQTRVLHKESNQLEHFGGDLRNSFLILGLDLSEKSIEFTYNDTVEVAAPDSVLSLFDVVLREDAANLVLEVFQQRQAFVDDLSIDSN